RGLNSPRENRSSSSAACSRGSGQDGRGRGGAQVEIRRPTSVFLTHAAQQKRVHGLQLRNTRRSAPSRFALTDLRSALVISTAAVRCSRTPASAQAQAIVRDHDVNAL